MNIKNNMQGSLDNVFEQRWRANNYNLNGIKDAIKNREDASRPVGKNNINDHSVNGRVSRLNDQMKTVFTNRNTFK